MGLYVKSKESPKDDWAGYEPVSDWEGFNDVAASLLTPPGGDLQTEVSAVMLAGVSARILQLLDGQSLELNDKYVAYIPYGVKSPFPDGGGKARVSSPNIYRHPGNVARSKAEFERVSFDLLQEVLDGHDLSIVLGFLWSLLTYDRYYFKDHWYYLVVEL